MGNIGFAEILLIALVLVAIVGATVWAKRGGLGAKLSGSREVNVWNGYGGINMSQGISHATRFLAASAVLRGSSFRRQILERLKDRQRAAAPEPGLDLGLVARVCAAMERRNRRYDLLFVVTAVAGVFIAGLTDSLLPLIAVVPVTAGLWFRKEYDERYRLAASFGKDAYDPSAIDKRFKSTLASELAEALPPDDQNVLVYQGFSPFVGAGIELGGWSFSLNIEKPKSDGHLPAAIPFTVEELYESLDHRLAALGLHGLRIRDYLFVNGADIRDDRELLPDAFSRPIAHVPEATLHQYLASGDTRVRHYKWIQILDWGNELVFSYFVRCLLLGPTLFVEIDRFLLTPLNDHCRSIDAIRRPRLSDHVVLLVGASIIGPISVTLGAIRLWGHLQERMQEAFGANERERHREIEQNPLFNYGASTSVRQTYASDRFVHYFQKLDGDFYGKVLDREILEAICALLDEHNIDTSDLRERQTMILNSGIIVHGGDVKAESLAVGTGAQAVKTTRPRGKAAEA